MRPGHAATLTQGSSIEPGPGALHKVYQGLLSARKPQGARPRQCLVSGPEELPRWRVQHQPVLTSNQEPLRPRLSSGLPWVRLCEDRGPNSAEGPQWQPPRIPAHEVDSRTPRSNAKQCKAMRSNGKQFEAARCMLLAVGASTVRNRFVSRHRTLAPAW